MHVPITAFGHGMHAHAFACRPSLPTALWKQRPTCHPPRLNCAQEALEGAARAMAQHRATRGADGPDAEQFEAACSALAGSVMPYIAACYARIYPEQRRLVDARAAAAPLLPAEALQPAPGASSSSGPQLVPVPA